MIGRLYRIDGGGKFYIGSTTQELKKRLKNHRSKSKESRRQITPLYQHFNIIGWASATITLIEEVEILNRLELLGMEDKLVRNSLNDPNCLNKTCVIVTPEQKREHDREYGKIRRESQKERERERVRIWRQNNPDKWKEQTKRYRLKKQASS
jgi:Uri superfamily endonuclease